MNVVFFPRNDYPNNIEVCKHRLGKKMTYSETTTDIPSYVQNTILPYFVSAHNSAKLRVGTYMGWNYPNAAWNTDYGKQQIADGVIYPDLYFYPGGTDAEHESEEHVLSVWNNDALPWFLQQFGRVPVAIDFSMGRTGYKQYLASYFLAADSSITELNKTDYGVGVGNPNNVPYSQSRYYPRNMNTRVLDYARIDIGNNSAYNTPQEKGYYDYYIAQMGSLIDATLALPNGGFILNFSHWHDVVKEDYNVVAGVIEGVKENRTIIVDGRETTKAIHWGFENYIDMLCQKNANDEIYFAGYGEAVAYLVYRQMITKAVMYSPNAHHNDQLVIRLEAKNTLNVDTALLQVPISVKFSTIGTPLEGQSIKSNCNLISLGSNQYIVEIPYSEYAGAVIEKLTT